jgi:hypothetical protein
MTNEEKDAGVRGDYDPVVRAENRRHLRVIEEAVYGGWDLPEGVSQAIPITLKGIMDDPNASVRDRIRASECLVALRRDRMEAAIQLDRIRRLDQGTATDRVEILKGLSDDALRAVAEVLNPPCPKPEAPKRKRK